MVEENNTEPSKQTRYYRRKQDDKASLEKNLLGIAGLTLDKLIDLFREFLRASNSNPAIGGASVFIISDILYRSKIIDIETLITIDTLMGVLDGSQIAGTIISDITDITHVFQKSAGNLDLQPSATTVVYADSTGGGNNTDALIKALLSRKA